MLKQKSKNAQKICNKETKEINWRIYDEHKIYNVETYTIWDKIQNIYN
jgi:hypothetical protein